jgi:chromosome segregation ATPase
MSTDKYEKMKAKAKSWMEKASEYENEIEKLLEILKDKDNDTVLLEENNKLKNTLTDLEKSYAKLEINMERNIMRKDAEIDRLKVSLEDYRERYKEIRDDNKELRKELRKN